MACLYLQMYLYSFYLQLNLLMPIVDIQEWGDRTFGIAVPAHSQKSLVAI